MEVVAGADASKLPSKYPKVSKNIYIFGSERYYAEKERGAFLSKREREAKKKKEELQS